MVDLVMQAEVDRQLPDAESDSTTDVVRAGRYREIYVLPISTTTHWLADEGTYFVATNPTPGTAIAGAVNAAVSETAGNLLYIKNNDGVGNSRNKRIYMQYLRLITTVAPASGLTGHCFMKVDNINRFGSGGTAITPTNVNMDTSAATVSQVYFGALTTVAPSIAARTVHRSVMRSVVPVINDETIFVFGGNEFAGASTLGGTVAGRSIIPSAPVIIGPQQNLCMQVWYPSNATTPASYEFEIGWFER